jgi:hypothetical protein
MNTTIQRSEKIELIFLEVQAGVRYWEDADVNGVSDENGDLIPCRRRDYWEPKIDIRTGIIINWEKGKTADIHYKVCDDGSYYLYGHGGELYFYRLNDYVPACLSPAEPGYGDYIIMKVDENGQIENWKFNQNHLDDFSPVED